MKILLNTYTSRNHSHVDVEIDEICAVTLNKRKLLAANIICSLLHRIITLFTKKLFSMYIFS